MGRCSVLGCKNDSEKKLPDISFHSFPENADLRQKWIEATGRTNWSPKKSSKICSSHFEQHELIKKKKITLLFPNAVPLQIKNPDIRDDIVGVIPSKADQEHTIEIDSDPSMNIKENEDIEPDAKLPSSSVRLSANVNQPTVDYTPRTLKRKWKKSEEQATEKLKKLKALREKSRRLSKKVANLEKMISELKAKSLISEEDGDLLESIDQTNRDFLKKFLNPSGSSRKYSPALRKFEISPALRKFLCLRLNEFGLVSKCT